MRPINLKTRIFLDSGDPNETKMALEMLGFLDGQTLNPSLLAKSPEVVERVQKNEKFTKDEIYVEYKKIADEVESIIPGGDISIEVYADKNTKAEDMVMHARDMHKWVNNSHIKLPLVSEGIRAARMLTDEEIPVNMTLCFSQDEAAATYSATLGAKHEVYVSPFLGRLDDIGIEGIDLFENIIKMYSNSDKHVKVLGASLRDLEHFMYSLYLGIDIITAPFKVLKLWAESGLKLPENMDEYADRNKFFSSVHPTPLALIPYKELSLDQPWESYDIHADLTDKGLDKFVQEWDSLLV